MASQQLATLTDFATLGPPPEAVSNVDDATKTAHLLAASSYVLGYVRKKKALPLVSWGQDLVSATVARAHYTLFKRRGFNPATAADQAVVDANDANDKWLQAIASEGPTAPELVDCIDSSVETEETAPIMYTAPRQRWLITGDDDDAGRGL